MSLSILQKATSVVMKPYPHIVIEDCLPEPLYEALEKTRPSDSFLVDTRPLGSNIRLDLHARDLLIRMNVSMLTGGGLSSYWREFIQYHLSVEFWREINHVFGAAEISREAMAMFRMRFPGKLLADCPVAIRDQPASKTAISMDVNVGVNTPVVGPATSVRGPHVDNPIELFAAMLYMPPKDAPDEGGDFVIYEKTAPVRFEGKAEVHRNDVPSLREYARVKYRRNTMVAFINSVNAIHGVTPRQSNGFRRLVNFCAELPFAAFTLPR